MNGVIVRENQLVSVSDANEVSQPVNAVVQTAADVTGAITTASDREAEGGIAGEGTILPETPAENPVPKTATVTVTFELPDDF